MSKNTSQSLMASLLASDVSNVAGCRRVVNKELGIEIECEGSRLPLDTPATWEIHRDGSLRGEAAEYVTRGPIARKDKDEVIDSLFDCFTANRTVLNNSKSSRTSVHVHINCSNVPLYKVINICTLHTIFESVLLNYCGDSRIGNIFCLSAKDANYWASHIRRCLASKDGRIDNLWGNDAYIRYSALNYAALGKYGTLEFRGMRGLDTAKEVKDWVDIVCILKDAAIAYRDPTAIVERMSVEGPIAFARSTFGPDVWAKLTEGLEEGDVARSLYEGVRIAQDIAYSFDWTQVFSAKGAAPPGKRMNPAAEQRLRLEPLEPAHWNEFVQRALARGDIQMNDVGVQAAPVPVNWDARRVAPAIRIDEGVAL